MFLYAFLMQQGESSRSAEGFELTKSARDEA
jgi:hypothetical protein